MSNDNTQSVGHGSGAADNPGFDRTNQAINAQANIGFDGMPGKATHHSAFQPRDKDGTFVDATNIDAG